MAKMIKQMLATTLLVLVVTVHCNSQDNDWLFHYTFDGNAVDDGANQNHGIINGKVLAVSDRFEREGKALSFDGNSGYILIPYRESLNLPAKNFSFSFWLKLHDYHKTNYWDFIKSDSYAPIFCKSESEQTFQYRFCLNSQGYEFDGVVENMMTGVVYREGPIVAKGKWQMISVTYNNEIFTLYVDGQKVDSRPYANKFVTDTHPLVIGKDLPGALEYLDGALDDFAIWDRVLSDQEISTYFQAQIKKPADNVAALITGSDVFNVKKGETIVLRSVLFQQSRTELLPSSYVELDKLVETLQRNTSIEIEISGHTDNVGSRLANIELSESRALKIKQYLMAHGIEKNRVQCKGFGPDRPLNKNKTPEEKVLNRRVEFRILKK